MLISWSVTWANMVTWNPSSSLADSVPITNPGQQKDSDSLAG